MKGRVPGLFVNARADIHWLTEDPPPISVKRA
jgi:hypothetical protein